MNQDKARQEKAEYRMRFLAQHLYGIVELNKATGGSLILTPQLLYEICKENLHAPLVRKDLATISDEQLRELARIILGKDKKWEPLEILDWGWAKKIIVNRQLDFDDTKTEVEMNILIDLNVNHSDISFTWDYNNEMGTAKDERHCPNLIHAYDYLRGESFALPFLGKSVAEQIQEQFIIIK